MAERVADVLWSMLSEAGVKRCYGIIGDALNPVIDALHKNGEIDFVHVRNEEAGSLAAVAEAYLTGEPVAICGTAGPGTVHLINGIIDAKREGAPVIAIAGDTASIAIDTSTVEEINPYDTFRLGSLYTGRITNPGQTRAVIQTAIRTSLDKKGPSVIAIPGDIAASKAPKGSNQVVRSSLPVVHPGDDHLAELAGMINAAGSVMIFGGDGCREAHDEVVSLARHLKAPVGFAYRGKQWLQWENPNSVGMTGLIGWGGAYEAMHNCDLLLMLGTDFPFIDFYPEKPRKVQIDLNPDHIGRRTELDLGVVGDVKDTLKLLLPLVDEKTDTSLLDHSLEKTAKWQGHIDELVAKGPEKSPIRPEFLYATLDRLADDDAVFTVDTGTPCIWAARHITPMRDRRILGSFSWATMANAMPYSMGASLAYPDRQSIALCGDGGLTMLLGDLLTLAERRLPVKVAVLNNGGLRFVDIEMEEAGIEPFGIKFDNPDFAALAEVIGIKGIRLEQPGDVNDRVGEFLSEPGPALLDVISDPQALSLPPNPTLAQGAGFTLSLGKQIAHGNQDDALNTIKRNTDLI